MIIYLEKQKRAIVDKAQEIGITLNGSPASIKGIKKDSGFVCSNKNPQGIEFCWETIERIVDSHGQFNS